MQAEIEAGSSDGQSVEARMDAASEAGSSDGQSVEEEDRNKEPLWVLPAGFEEDGISKDHEGLDTDLLVGASELLAT